MAGAPLLDEGVYSETIESLSDTKFRQNFETMRQAEEMCDITLKVEEISFKAHKLILAGCSPYFRIMFGQKKFTEADRDKVTIDPEGQLGIKAKAVGQLIDYIYTGCLEFDGDNTIDIIWAADLFQLSSVKEQGLERLEDLIDFSTYLDICEVGTFFSRPRLLNVVNRFLRENFEEFSSSSTFLDLPANDVCTYLKHKNLKTKSEETVLQAAIQWCKHNQDWDQFSAMSDHIQFNLISVPTLCNLLREDSHFKSAEISRNLILKKMEAIERPIVVSKPRFSSHMLIAMPYRSKNFFVINFQGADTIDFSVKEFPEIISDQINSLVNYQICQFEHYVFLAGGTSCNAENESYPSDRGFIYNILTNTWSTGPTIPNPGYGFGIAALDNKIMYVPNDDGPGKITSMDVYDLKNLEEEKASKPKAWTHDGFQNKYWVTTAQMNYRRAQVQMIVLDDFVYGLGGMESGGFTSIVERFDPVEQYWSEIDSMSQGRCTPGVAVGDGKLFVVGGLGDNLIGPPGPLKTAEFYDPTSDSWTLLPDMYFPRHSPSVAYKNRRLYVFGGGSPAPLLRPGPERTIEVFDFDKHEWFVHPMKIPGRANAIYVSCFFDDLEIE